MATIIEDLSRIRAIHTDSEYVYIYQKYSTYLLNGIKDIEEYFNTDIPVLLHIKSLLLTKCNFDDWIYDYKQNIIRTTMTCSNNTNCFIIINLDTNTWIQQWNI